ncbi:MobF family relaxase [Duganella sp. PWIR1]
MMSKPYTIKKGGNTVEYLKATEYFINADGTQRDASHWQGAGAEALGIAGKAVDAEAFERVLDGFAPDGSRLTKNAGSERREKVGFDCVNSPPKSVSLAMAYASPELRDAIIKASEQANAESVKYLQDNLTIRTGKGGAHLEPCAGLAVATFTHMTSRALDPQMHHHNAMAAMAMRQDGSWGSIDGAELLAHYKTAGAIYQAQLAKNLNAMGFQIVPDQKSDFAFEVAGFTDEAKGEFSQGRKKVLDYLKARNLDPKNRDACDRAAKAVREEKHEPAFGDLLAVWRARGEPHGLDATAIDGLRTGIKQTPTIDGAAILAELTEQQSVFERKDVLQAVAIAAGRSGGMTRAEIEAATDKILFGDAFALGEHVKKSDRITSGLLASAPVKLGTYHPEQANIGRPPQKLKTRHLYTTPEAIREELGLMLDFRAASEDKMHDRTAGQVAEARAKYEAEMSEKIGKPVSMKAEQVTALEHVATAGRHVLINGLSGTGKSFTMGAVRAMEEAAGQRVIGVALAGNAAAGLKEGAGIAEGGTLAKLLSDARRGKITLDAKTTIILDEAAMVGARQFRQLQRLAPESKIVILGDRLQYQNIERGAWMGGLQDLGFKVAELNDIERQKIDWHRNAVLNLKDGRGAEALEAFRANGQMIFENSTDEALKRMARDIADDSTDWTQKIGIVPTHEKAGIVNDEVRRLRIERGELSDEAHWVELQTSQNAPKVLRELREGERLQFKKTSAVLGVNNGEEATLTGITRHRNTGDAVLHLLRDDGKQIAMALSEYDAFTYGYAGTGNSKQGASKHHAYTFLDPDSLNKQAAYVIASRSKQETWLYGTTADCEDTADALANLGRAMSRDGSKDWTLDYLTPEQRESFGAKLDAKAATATAAPTIPAPGQRQATPEPKASTVAAPTTPAPRMVARM